MMAICCNLPKHVHSLFWHRANDQHGGCRTTKDIEIVEEFFGLQLAQQLAAQGKQADLTTANMCWHMYRTLTISWVVLRHC